MVENAKSIFGQEQISNNLSHKQEMIKTLENKGIFSYEPNLLDGQGKKSLLLKIKTAINETKDVNRQENLHELYDYIDKNGFIFPEFSHGTSSDALEDIAMAGIYPEAIAKGLYQEWKDHGQVLGEGRRGGNLTENWIISAGAGQGGLGTAMAYADIIENPDWNPNIMSEGELTNGIKKYEGFQKIKQDQFIEDIKQRYEKALGRMKNGIEPDFPILVGFTRTRQCNGPENLEKGQWRQTITYENGKQIQSITGFNGEFDSEVILGGLNSLDQIMPLDIPVIACPKNKIPEARRIMEKDNKYGKDRIQIISLEAIRELENFGYDRISKAEKATLKRNIQNLENHKVSEKFSEIIFKNQNKIT